MKVLTSEQQAELQSLLESVEGLAIDVQHQINYWANELKPKRIRRKIVSEEAETGVDNQ